MKPIQMKVANGQTKVLFLCTRCKKEHRNKLAEDDDIDALMEALKEKENVLLYTQ
jgi:hypothetical protein